MVCWRCLVCFCGRKILGEKYHVKKVYNSTCFGYMMLFYFGTFLPCVVNLLSLN